LKNCLGKEKEENLVTYMKKVHASGFLPTGESLPLGLLDGMKFLTAATGTKILARWDWLDLFLRRWPGLIKKISHGLFIGRIMAVNRKHIEDYFNLLLAALTEKRLLDRPGHICNMDECGFQMNPKSHTVTAEKGPPTLYQMKRGETESMRASCNDEGYVIPPACIIKGENNKLLLEESLQN
jgi:hypothetical protein